MHDNFLGIVDPIDRVYGIQSKMVNREESFLETVSIRCMFRFPDQEAKYAGFEYIITQVCMLL